MSLHFARDDRVQPMAPYQGHHSRFDRSDHTILLQLVQHSGEVTVGRLEVGHPVNISRDILAALRPQEARRLARQLSVVADSLESTDQVGR